MLVALFISTPILANETDTNSNSTLNEIKQITWQILVALNQSPAYIRDVTRLAKSWLEPDDSDATAINQQLLHHYGEAVPVDYSYIQQLNNSFTSATTDSSTVNVNSFNALLSDKNNDGINDIRAYLQNISGASLHQGTLGSQIAALGTRDANAIQNEKAYYATLTSVQSYNNYIISHFYHHFSQRKSLDKLVQNASRSDWLAQAASEPLGKVLRQILYYESQHFVLQARLLETQENALGAQAMTNTLLIMLIQSNHRLLNQLSTLKK